MRISDWSSDVCSSDLLAGSEELIGEIEAADTIIITAPIYNFAIPASLKAWIDQVTRARRTFSYTEVGPEGLLRGKRAYIVFASGGVPLGSQVDFASGYLRHILGFIGITDVHVIAADGHQRDGEAIARAATATDGLKTAACPPPAAPPPPPPPAPAHPSPHSLQKRTS